MYSNSHQDKGVHYLHLFSNLMMIDVDPDLKHHWEVPVVEVPYSKVDILFTSSLGDSKLVGCLCYGKVCCIPQVFEPI